MDKEVYKLWREFLKESTTYQSVCDWVRENSRRHPIAQKEAFPPFYYKGDDPLYNCDAPDRRLPKLTRYFIKNHLDKNGPNSPEQRFRDDYFHLWLYKPYFCLSHYVKYFLPYESGGNEPPFSFFSWAYKYNFPYSKEILVVYFIFQDIYNEPFEKYWDRVLFIADISKEMEANNIGNLNNLLEFKMETTVSVGGLDPDSEGSDEYNELMDKIWFSEDMKFLNSFFDQDDNLITDLSTIKIGKGHYKKYLNVDKIQFEHPQKNVRMDELKRYLEVFRLRKSGKSISEIAKIIYPKQDPTDPSVERSILRDRNKAHQIIKNTEIGLFPGSYK